MLATVMTRPAGVIAIVAVNVYSVYGSVRYLTLEHPLRWGSLELLTAANILLGTVLAVALFSMRNWARWAFVVIYAASLAFAPVRVALAHDLIYIIRVLAQSSLWAWAIWYLFRPHVKEAFRAA